MDNLLLVLRKETVFMKYKVLTTTQGVLYVYDSQDYLGYTEKYK